jgi:hypothetical protein
VALTVGWCELRRHVEIAREDERDRTTSASALVDERREVGEHPVHRGDGVPHVVALAIDLLRVLLPSVERGDREVLAVEGNLCGDDTAGMRVVLERDRPQRTPSCCHPCPPSVLLELGPQHRMRPVGRR